MEKRRLWLFVLFMSFALILSGGSMVLAQEDSDEGSKEPYEFLLEEVIVTGSRIAREDGFGQPSPVTVMGLEDISSFGLTRIEDVLNTMPQIEPDQSAFIQNGSTGTASLDLRGLGPARTLVLMNGRRMQPGGTNTQFVDINQIPTALVERVEVLTGGASAIYGADAVAGVVNFIMRDVQGIELIVGGGAYQHDNSNGYMQGLMDDDNISYPTGDTGLDGKSYDISLIMGSDFAGGKGNATVYASYQENDALLMDTRDYANCALMDWGACGGSSNAIVPNFAIAPMSPDAEDGEIDWVNEGFFALQPDGSILDGNYNIFNYNPYQHFLRPDKRWTAGAFLDYEVNEKTTAYMEIQYFNDRSHSQMAFSGTFYDANHILPLTYFPAEMQPSLAAFFPGQEWFKAQIGKRNVEGAPRDEITDHTSLRMVAGIKGAINDNWDYDVSYLKGRTTSSSTYLNDMYKPAVLERISPDCAADPDCLDYDVFTYEGVTPEQAADLMAVGVSNNETEIQVFSGVVTGDTGFGLDAGNIVVAGGLEWREETYEDIRDYVYEEGLLMGQGGPRPSLVGEFDVFELFGEASIPLLVDMPAAKDLTLNLALRWSDHNITGSDTTYRVGLDWQTNDILRVRTGYNRAVRSPNLEEFFEVEYVNLWYGSDPCANNPYDPDSTPSWTAEQCARTGVTAAQYGNMVDNPAGQLNMMRGGNPNLEPEEADTFTFGVVVEPIENLTLSLDYWSIEIDKVIDRIGSALILDMCGLEDQLCEYVHRAPSGTLWQIKDGYIYDIMWNLGAQESAGLDFAGSYWLDALEGTWNVNMIGTYMLDKETTPLADDPSSAYDCVGKTDLNCYPTPKWRHTASVTYDSNEFWSVTARWRYFSSVDQEYTEDVQGDIGSYNYIDLSSIFKFRENDDIIIGINNVLDKEPPLVGASLSGEHANANTVASFYDNLGRFFYARVTFRF